MLLVESSNFIFRIAKSKRAYPEYHIEKRKDVSVNKHDSNGNSIMYYILSRVLYTNGSFSFLDPMTKEQFQNFQKSIDRIAKKGYIPFKWEIDRLKFSRFDCKLLEENRKRSKEFSKKVLRKFLINDVVNNILQFL